MNLQNIFLLIAIFQVNVSSSASDPSYLAMQVFCTHGHISMLEIKSDHSIDDGALQGQPIHNIKVTSGIGSASLKVKSDQIEIEHTGNAWAVVLDPPEDVKKNLNYLSQLTGQDIFKPNPFPKGLTKPIKKNGIFLIVVPIVEDEPFEVKPNDMISSLLSFNGTDEVSAIEIFNRFTNEYVKDQLIFLAIGRIVDSPKQDALVHPSFSLSDVMKMLMTKPAFPYAFGNSVVWNFQNIIAANIAQKTGQLAFASADGISSAGVELCTEDQGKNIKTDKLKLLYAQKGRASVYVLSPSRMRFVFPISKYTDGGSSFPIESPEPKLIEGEVENGDIVVILIFIRGKQRWNVRYKKVLKFLARLTINYAYLQPNAVVEELKRLGMDNSKDVFLSFSTIVRNTDFSKAPQFY